MQSLEALDLELEERLAADTDGDTDWRAGLHRIARATYAVCTPGRCRCSPRVCWRSRWPAGPPGSCGITNGC
ncbi:hypothetical protein ACFUKV_30490 [Streptomyces paradoxus]|uniref:hypothetical protein n=1 Tax=Streptomyces paradoxus TaxID=66375 RepID=UPI0036443D18